MNFTKEQIQEQRARVDAHLYRVWQIRLAARTNNFYSEHHPKSIRERITELHKLLTEAKV